MFEYDRASMKATETFDKYDLTEFLSDCYDKGLRDPWDIRCQLGWWDGFGELETAVDDLSTDEFMEYLSARYNVKFEEVISYRMWYVR